ncbi:ABC transporter substrate-binding protein [Sulfitobacter sp. LCG007]
MGCGARAVVLGVFVAATSLVGAAATQQAAPAARTKPDVLAIGGSVTEIVYALGEGDRLIARDSTSTYPPEAAALPDVGYMRALSSEGVLSVGPELIISEDGAGPPEVLDVLQAASVDWITIPDDFTAEGIRKKISAVGAALDVSEKADALSAKVGGELAEVAERAAAHDGAPRRVLFILSLQGGRILASGTNTAANGIIGLAGAVNAIDAFEGYKPLTDEAVNESAPDVILMMDRGGDHGASDDALFAMPALVTTPAARTRAVIRMDGLYLLGFGPRTAQAAAELNRRLYGS